MEKPKKILLIDDEEDILAIVSFKLKHSGYDVVAVSEAEQGLRIAGEETFDLMLLDVMMPVMNGFEVCKKLRDDKFEGKIVLYTAKVDGVDAARARQAGADDFTVKTSGLELICETIAKLLN